jgi:Polysaccharide lyase
MTHPGKLIIPLIIFLFIGSGCRTKINVYDGFESRRLSRIWETDRMVPASLEIQSDVVCKGKRAAKITLRTGDIYEPGTGKSAPTERDELEETGFLESVAGIKYEYQFSMFIPQSFPIVNTRLVIAQWKQNCPHGAACSDDSPVVAIRYVAGELYITLRTDSGSQTLYKTDNDVRNQWLNFRFQIRFSRQSNGEIKAFMNDNEIINYKGITSYSEARGYASKSRYYFKMGLYRDIMQEPMTIYIDEYRKREMTD